jgi:hypothetical protein
MRQSISNNESRKIVECDDNCSESIIYDEMSDILIEVSNFNKDKRLSNPDPNERLRRHDTQLDFLSIKQSDKELGKKN